jgi:hypothetical protein
MLRVSALDALTGEPIKGVLFELEREFNQNPEEGLTEVNGSYDFMMSNLGTYTIKTIKNGY